MHDTEMMFEQLKLSAEGNGLRYAGVSTELLEAFGCTDVNELQSKLWSVYHILRTGRLKRYAGAGMAMLDISEYADEQPTKDPKDRLEVIKRNLGFVRADRAWQEGLRDLVDHFDAVVNHTGARV